MRVFISDKGVGKTLFKRKIQHACSPIHQKIISLLSGFYSLFALILYMFFKMANYMDYINL